MIKIRDFEKIESPFVRKMVDGNYVVTNEVADDMRWVFEDESVIATEKLHGTNCSVIIQEGAVLSIWNRTERIPFINKSKAHIVEGVLEACRRGYLDLPDGQWFGECIGPKINGNPYQLDKHVWIPFERIRESLAYKSWAQKKYPKTFESMSEWFKVLQPLYCWKIHSKEKSDKDAKYAFVEGIVFYQPSTGKMAKVRKDMWPWAPEHGLKPHKEEEVSDEKV